MVAQTNEIDKILNLYFTSEFRTGYKNYEGFLMPEYFESIIENIEDLEVCNDDIWVCSFPKTGKHFISNISIFLINCIFKKINLKIVVNNFYF